MNDELTNKELSQDVPSRSKIFKDYMAKKKELRTANADAERPSNPHLPENYSSEAEQEK